MKTLTGLHGREVEPLRIMADGVTITEGKKHPLTLSENRGGTTMPNTQDLTRKQAGDQLDALTKELMEEKEISYEVAFNRVCKQEPELFKAYMPAAAKH